MCIRDRVLIDEYDKPILDVLDTEACFSDDYGKQVLLEKHNREILKSFYSTFKAVSYTHLDVYKRQQLYFDCYKFNFFGVLMLLY